MSLHLLFNFGIAASYLLIPVALFSVTVSAWRQIAPFRGTLLKFAAFILSCAIGHILEGLEIDHNKIDLWHGITFVVSALVALQMPLIAKEAVQFAHRAEHQAQALKASEARFQAFLDCPRLVAWTKDADLVNIWGNRTMVERFGPQGIGVRDDEWLPADVAAVTLANDRRVLETGEPHEIVEIVPTADGVLRSWLSYKFLLKVGKTPYVGGIAIEVTDREQLQQELERSNQELEQFAYAASHDLKTPLRGISGLLAILQRSLTNKLNEQEQKIVEQIMNDCGYAIQLVDGILQYSRVGRQKSVQTVDVGTVLSQVCGRMEESVQQNNAKITWGTMPTIRVDPTQLAQILENLFSNALKYRSEEPPSIHVSSRMLSKEWVFAVQDNGIGINPEHQDQLFTMFYRLHGRSEIEGTGIGLAIVRRIAQRHGGNAWVQSKGKGCGSTFYFSIARTLHA